MRETRPRRARVTLKAVAIAAGVSPSTASRVLSGQGSQFRIPPETADAVVQAAQQIGYSLHRRHFKPEALRTGTLGVVVPDISHFFHAQMVRTMIERVGRRGKSVLVMDSLEDSARERQWLEQLVARDVDGLLLMPVGKDWEHIRELVQRPTPIVLMDRVAPDLVCHRVSIDNFHAAFEATEYLLQRGHRRIACVQRLPQAWISEERVRGYREALRAAGITPDDALILGSQFGQHNGYLEVKRLLELKPRPTAILALSHLVTLEALRALRDHQLAVPDDMSLVGFDEVPHAEFFSEPITTVAQPIQEMARMAVDLLLAEIENPNRSKPLSVQLPCTLVRRQSVKSLS